jgi:DNA-binding NarL/FixJ family response regulator
VRAKADSDSSRELVCMTFLIVEDNSEMRRLIRRAVTRKSDIVYECNDGSDALASYMEHGPDWVLMDIKMPKLDGISATLRIKKAFPEARIVVVSQYDDPEVREGACRAGAAGYVLKDNLLAILEIIGRSDHTGRVKTD